MKCPSCNSEAVVEGRYCHYCGFPLSPAAEGKIVVGPTRNFNRDFTSFLSPGDRFGSRYTILEEIGRGGMGQVYKARDRDLNTVVALKMIRPELVADATMIDRFKQEILLARNIAHENVVRIYDLGENNGVKYVSMQYIKGITLKTLIQDREKLDFKRVKSITKKICRGLLAAHRKGIVHRDLSPHNIMVDENDNVFITDFGLAKSSTGGSISRTGAVLGTPQYIAPEQWLGEKVDNRADIYTLGIIVYEMVTGHPPFVSETEVGYFQKHLNEKPILPKNLDMDVPPYFRYIIKKCLEKKGEYRYRDTKDILDDIDTCTFRKDSLLKRIKKHRVAWKITVSALLGLAVYGGVKLLGGSGQKVPRFDSQRKLSVAVLPFRNVMKDKNLDKLRLALAHLLINDLEQSKFFSVLSESRLFHILKGLPEGDEARYNALAGQKIRTLSNVSYIIEGSFVASGEDLRTSIRIIDIEEEKLLGTFEIDTKRSDILNTIDLLTVGIKKKFDFTEPILLADIDRNVGTVTTSSSDALTKYIDGKVLFNKEEYRDSIAAFREAVRLDPKFALAYKGLALSCAYQGNWEDVGKNIEAAMKHGKSLPKTEQLLIAAHYYDKCERDPGKSIRSLEKLLSIDPYNYEGLTQMGIHLYAVEEWDRAIEYLSRVADESNPDYQAHGFLALCYMCRGDYDRARLVVEKYHQVFSRKYLLQNLIYNIYLIQRRFDLAEAAREKIKEIKLDAPGDYSPNRGEIFFFRGDFENASREFAVMWESAQERERFRGRQGLEQLYLVRGKFDQVAKMLLKDIDYYDSFESKAVPAFQLVDLYLRRQLPGKALSVIKNLLEKDNDIRPFLYRRVLFYKALCRLAQNRLNLVEGLLKELQEAINNSPFKRDIKLYHFIRGKLAQKHKDYPRALSEMETARSLWSRESLGPFLSSSQALFLFELAMAYHEADKLEKASKRLEELTLMTRGRAYYGDLYARSFYFLGKIYQELGWKGKAIDKYATFLELWEKGDGNLEERDDALHLLKKLRPNGP